MCNWTEPNLSAVEGLPTCIVHGRDAPPAPPGQPGAAGVTSRALFDGTLIRVETCELEYGPLNCDFVFRGSNEPFLDEATMPAVRQGLGWRKGGLKVKGWIEGWGGGWGVDGVVAMA